MRAFTYHFDAGEEQFSYRHEIGGAPPRDNLPEWTSLDFHDCPGCRALGHTHCLAAAAIVEPVKMLDKLVSHDHVMVSVEGPERTYSKASNAQEALSSLLGMLMATSGCPSYDFLKGLAWYHLPFASFEETLFRAISAYLVKNHLQGRVRSPDEATGEIQALYDQVRNANLGMSKRLREGVAAQTDSSMNALIILDSFGALVPISAEAGLADLKRVFLE